MVEILMYKSEIELTLQLSVALLFISLETFYDRNVV